MSTTASMSTTVSADGFGSSTLTGAQLWERAGIIRKVEGKMRARLRPKRSQQPSIQSVAQVVCWAFVYATIEGNPPLDEKNPYWAEFFVHSEWFRLKIAKRIGRGKNLTWDEIYRLTGFLREEEYKDLEDYYEHHYFGAMIRVDHPCASRMLKDLEEIKYLITGRL